MSYIGREPQIGNFQVCDAISTVNNQAAYTMQVGGVNVSPETANHMLVSLNGILQAPTSSFTVSGSVISFAANLVTGDVINFIHILGSVLDLGVPSDSTVSLAKLTATGTKNSTTFLRGDNTFASAGGDNTPAFKVLLSGDQSLSDNAQTKVTFNTEVFDTNNAFASNKFTVPSGQAGKYIFPCQLTIYNTNQEIFETKMSLYKNNSETVISHYSNGDAAVDRNSNSFSPILDLSVGDYIEIYATMNTHGGVSGLVLAGNEQSFFQGYKLLI